MRGQFPVISHKSFKTSLSCGSLSIHLWVFDSLDLRSMMKIRLCIFVFSVEGQCHILVCRKCQEKNEGIWDLGRTLLLIQSTHFYCEILFHKIMKLWIYFENFKACKRQLPVNGSEEVFLYFLFIYFFGFHSFQNVYLNFLKSTFYFITDSSIGLSFTNVSLQWKLS